MSDRPSGANVPVVVTLLLSTAVGFGTWFSRSTMDAGIYRAYYRSGIYRYRVVGREAVWELHRLIGNPLGEHLPHSTVGANPGAMFTAFVVFNGTCFVLTCWLVGRLLRTTGLGEPARTLVFLTVAALVALSGYVVTPYDQLGYLLVLAVLVAAESGPPVDLAAPVLAIVAVCNRETAFVAVAALLAAQWPLARGRRSTITLVTAGVTVVGYLVLRLAQGGFELWEQVTLAGNLGRLTGWLGLILIGLMLWWWWAVCTIAGLVAPSEVRRFWAFATPYLVVVGLTGYWFEVRLIVPMVVAELWIRCRVRGST